MTTEDSPLSTESIIVLMTLPSFESAQRLAKSLVDERFAACVTILPQIQSVYRWKGQVCDEPEVLCLAKTRAQLFDALREKVIKMHPYEIPEIIALPITQGHLPYLAWIFSETRNQDPSEVGLPKS